MIRNVLLSSAIAALFVSGCKPTTMERQGQAKSAPPAPAASPLPSPPAPASTQTAAAPAGERVGEDPAKGYEIWKLTAQVPPETMEAAKKQGGCPRTFLMGLFGLDWSSLHGCVIGKLTPGGPAERAGLKVGDGIASCNGREVSCPSSLAGAVQASFDGPTPGKLTLLIRRPLSGPATAPAPAPGPK